MAQSYILDVGKLVKKSKVFKHVGKWNWKLLITILTEENTLVQLNNIVKFREVILFEQNICMSIVWHPGHKSNCFSMNYRNGIHFFLSAAPKVNYLSSLCLNSLSHYKPILYLIYHCLNKKNIDKRPLLRIKKTFLILQKLINCRIYLEDVTLQGVN